MAATEQIEEAVADLLRELLEVFDGRVPETGPFPDLRAGTPFPFADDGTQGRLELVVMSMDPKHDPAFAAQRFVSVRVKKSPRGGTASVSCFHGTKAEVRGRLEAEASGPVYLADRVAELANGLPEESNPELWQ